MKKLILIYILLLHLTLLMGCKPIPKPNYNVNQDLTSVFNQSQIEADDEFHRIFSNDINHKITIEISRKEWDKLNNSMLSYARQFNGDLRSDTYIKAKMVYEDLHGKLIIHDIGFRTRGNNTRTLLVNPDGTYNLSHFKIKFNETFDYIKESKNYTMLSDRKVFDVEELILKYQDEDVSHTTELYANQLMNQVGVLSPVVSLSELIIKIDQEVINYGLYYVIEPIDKEFIDKRFPKDESSGNLYKSLIQDDIPASLESIISSNQIGIKNVEQNYRPLYDLKTNKKEPNYQDLKSFILSINKLNDKEFVDYLNRHFELDSFIRLLALNVLIGNADDYRGYGNNYYLYFNSKTEKFMMIPDDLDQSFGIADSKYTFYSDIYHWRSQSNLFQEDEFRPLSDKILKQPEYQLRYEYYIKEFMKENNHLFTYGSFKDHFEKLKQNYSTYTFNDHYIKQYFNIRNEQIIMQLEYYEQHTSEKAGDVN